MRKLFCLALALCLALCGLACAEGELVTFDFVDFTMDVPADIMGSIVEREENQPFFMLFQDYDESADFNANMNCVWTNAHTDFSNVNIESFGSTVMQMAAQQLNAQGLAASNMTFIGGMMQDLNGKPALAIIYSYDADYSNLGKDYQTTLYVLQAYVSEKEMGSYTFTVTTEDMENIGVLDAMMDSIVWKN